MRYQAKEKREIIESGGCGLGADGQIAPVCPQLFPYPRPAGPAQERIAHSPHSKSRLREIISYSFLEDLTIYPRIHIGT